MRYLVASAPDNASCNLRDRLLELAHWRELDRFDGAPVYELAENSLADEDGAPPEGPLAMPGQLRLLTLAGRHLYAEELEARLAEAGLPEPELLVFLSRHSAASGRPSLTLHPTGNYGPAEFGGLAGVLSMAAPRWMTGALRAVAVQARAEGLEHGVGFEVTHHGPKLATPHFFIEIGSEQSQWSSRPPALALARALLTARQASGPVLVGVGGGHYAPRFTDVGLNQEAAMGHMIPAYALEGLSREQQGVGIL